MEENTFRGKEKALTDEEKARYARRFVSRYINGELTGKEKAIVEGLQADAKEHELTDEELERRVIRGFDRLAGTLGMEKLTSAEERRLARRFPARHSPARHSPARHSPARSFLTKRSPARHRAGGLTRPPRIAVAAAAVAAVLLIVVGLNIPGAWHSLAPGKENNLPANTRALATGREMQSFTLPDGSTAWLNANTTLTLHEGNFRGHAREVRLVEGEAFFEVAKDPARPFIVHTDGGLETRVLGTSFNVKAYRATGEQVVSVLTGKVQVKKPGGQQVQLVPHRKARFHEESNSLEETATDGAFAAAWREGALLFDDASPRELKLKIEARYGATVTVIDNAIPLDSRLKASFPADARLEQVSRQVAEMYGISYRIEGQHVIFE